MGRDKEKGVGSAAPPIDLSTEEGERHKLENYSGKPVLVSFLSHAA